MLILFASDVCVRAGDDDAAAAVGGGGVDSAPVIFLVLDAPRLVLRTTSLRNSRRCSARSGRPTRSSTRDTSSER